MLTKKRKQVLDFIKDYQKRKKYSPSLEEIRKRFKFVSVSTADFHILYPALLIGWFNNEYRNKSMLVSLLVSILKAIYKSKRANLTANLILGIIEKMVNPFIHVDQATGLLLCCEK